MEEPPEHGGVTNIKFSKKEGKSCGTKLYILANRDVEQLKEGQKKEEYDGLSQEKMTLRLSLSLCISLSEVIQTS